MRYGRKCLTLLFMLLAISVLTGSAAFADGLKKENGKLYYYQNGKPVKNKWKTVKKHKYYFGKDGAAYQAPKPADKTCNVNKYKIKGKYYGFDTNGWLVKGLNAHQTLKKNGRTKSVTLYWFSSKGVYNKNKTKAVKQLLKEGFHNGQFMEELKKIAGKPRKTLVDDISCNQRPDANHLDDDENTHRWKDITIEYKGLLIVAVYYIPTDEYYVDYYVPLKK